MTWCVLTAVDQLATRTNKCGTPKQTPRSPSWRRCGRPHIAGLCVLLLVCVCFPPYLSRALSQRVARPVEASWPFFESNRHSLVSTHKSSHTASAKRYISRRNVFWRAPPPPVTCRGTSIFAPLHQSPFYFTLNPHLPTPHSHTHVRCAVFVTGRGLSSTWTCFTPPSKCATTRRWWVRPFHFFFLFLFAGRSFFFFFFWCDSFHVASSPRRHVPRFQASPWLWAICA